MASTRTFTERELDVMSILWKEGSGTVAEVRDELSDRLGYTGVLKILQILEEKGMVRHEREGRAYRYRPLAQPEAAGLDALGRIVDKMFQGSTGLALETLLAERPLEHGEAERIKEILDATTRTGNGSTGPDSGH